MKNLDYKKTTLDSELLNSSICQIRWKELYHHELNQAVVNDQLSPRTKTSYFEYIQRFLEQSPQMTVSDVDRFLNQKEHSPAVRSMKLKALKDFSARFSQHSKINEILSLIETVRFDEETTPTKALSLKECLILRKFFSTYIHGLYAFTFDFLLATGVRISELSSLAMDVSCFEFPDTHHAYACVLQKRKRRSKLQVLRKLPILDLALVQELRRFLNLPYTPQFYSGQGFAVRMAHLESLTQKRNLCQISWYPLTIQRKPYPFEKLKVRNFTLFPTPEVFRQLCRIARRETGIRFHAHRLRATYISLLENLGWKNQVVQQYIQLVQPMSPMSITIEQALQTIKTLQARQEPGNTLQISESDRKNLRQCYMFWVGHQGLTAEHTYLRYANPANLEIISDWNLFTIKHRESPVFTAKP